MANNYDAFTMQLLAGAVQVARTANIPMFYLNRAIEREAGRRGSKIDVPITAEVATNDVVPANVPPATADQDEGLYTVTLDKWREAPWYVTDKEVAEVQAGLFPAKMRAATESLITYICGTVYDNYKEAYSQAGTPGTVPFSSDITEGGQVGDLLTAEKAPGSVRWMGLSLGAASKAKILPEFASADRAGTDQTIRLGTIGLKLGINWLPDQQTPRHTTAANAGTYTVNSAAAVGDDVVDISAAGQNLVLVKGDIITFAGDNNPMGDPQQYTVMQDVTVNSTSNGNVSVRPNVRVAKAGSEAVTVIGEGSTYEVSLGGHESGIAFASRMSEDYRIGELLGVDGSPGGGGGSVLSDQNVADPYTGLVLRLRMTAEHYRTRMALSCLWGTGVPDGRLLVRLAGA